MSPRGALRAPSTVPVPCPRVWRHRPVPSFLRSGVVMMTLARQPGRDPQPLFPGRSVAAAQPLRGHYLTTQPRLAGFSWPKTATDATRETCHYLSRGAVGEPQQDGLPLEEQLLGGRTSCSRCATTTTDSNWTKGVRRANAASRRRPTADHLCSAACMANSPSTQAESGWGLASPCCSHPRILLPPTSSVGAG
jgi:hypothetical protein